MVMVFTDMISNSESLDTQFDAFKHLKYNKHEVVLFHLSEPNTEINLDFDNKPYNFIDVEKLNFWFACHSGPGIGVCLYRGSTKLDWHRRVRYAKFGKKSKFSPAHPKNLREDRRGLQTSPE